MDRGLLLREEVERRVETNLPAEGHRLVRSGELAYNMMRMWQGVCRLATFDCLISPAYVVLTPRPGVDPKFAEYFLRYEETVAEFRRLAFGVVDDRLRLYFKDFCRVEATLPSSEVVQRKIAKILTTVDNLIEKTEALIAKYQAVKQGLMNDLFTRGVDEHGRLRPTHEEAPELYKESELGWIPKKWEVDYLTNRVSLPQGQVDPRRSPYRDWILIAPDHIEQRTGRLLQRATAAAQNAISGKYIFDSGDVVYSKIRPYLRKATLASEHGICSADMYPLRPDANLRPGFLLGIVLSEAFSQFAESVSERSGFPKINRSELAEFRTAFPSTEEQDRICSLSVSFDERIDREEELLSKYRLLKTGLMQDLLTSKVRVKTAETEPPA